ncbi:baseplate assembly protein [Alphaproteobacteria bacterium]|nr:baseplate assembly protein [Alphaproteobacteria bacterium]
MIEGRIKSLGNDIKNKITIGVPMRIRDATEGLTCQIQGRAGEQRDNVTMVYPFGFDAYPNSGGAETIVLVVGGNNRYCLAPMDRRSRDKSGVKEAGDVALYNVKARITIKEDGTIEVRGKRLDLVVEEDVSITAPGGVTMETPLLKVTGDILDQSGGSGRSMAGMRGVYNGHTHPGDSGGTTGAPDQGQ